jgi:hypothetical protein
VCERPLPPSAALLLTEGETRAKRARGSLTHHLEFEVGQQP